MNGRLDTGFMPHSEDTNAPLRFMCYLGSEWAPLLLLLAVVGWAGGVAVAVAVVVVVLLTQGRFWSMRLKLTICGNLVFEDIKK
ncbi:hypothetical protein E2C01_049367 [Portunus trituberculatus]|uniref:Uncharacterized protein n=1 Tax=Portunus trituberculatus TaxID=210409 RepID=A0A5B7G994_PORTR|nr:hypothetical protein [Portunus trituberculatus]